MDTQQEVKQLQDEIVQIKAELFTLQRNQSSRRGLDGARGPAGRDGVGIPGAPGRDAVIKIVQADGKITVVSPDGTVAEIVAVAGPQGSVGPQGLPGRDSNVAGPKGDAGISPDVDEVVRKVVKQIGARLA